MLTATEAIRAAAMYLDGIDSITRVTARIVRGKSWEVTAWVDDYSAWVDASYVWSTSFLSSCCRTWRHVGCPHADRTLTVLVVYEGATCEECEDYHV